MRTFNNLNYLCIPVCDIEASLRFRAGSSEKCCSLSIRFEGPMLLANTIRQNFKALIANLPKSVFAVSEEILYLPKRLRPFLRLRFTGASHV